MPAVRNTPKRRRMECPVCGRDTAFTNPWANDGQEGLERDYQTAVLTAHKNDVGAPCTVNGPNGFGVRLP